MSRCKIMNCPNPSEQERGVYARLCSIHKAEHSLIRAGKPKKYQPYLLKNTAVRLVELSERIDNSAADFRQSRNQLLMDINHFNKVLEELKMGLKTLVTDHAN